MSKIRKGKDITGKTYNRLTAIQPTDQRKNGGIVWEFKCKCENIVYDTIANVEQGHKQSCGCLKNENLKKLHKQRNSSRSNTGFKGVTYRKNNNKYIATIYTNKKHYYLGGYDTPEEASIIRNQAEKAKEGKYFLEWYETLNKKSSWFTIKISYQDKQKLEQYAENHNKNVSELISEYIKLLK
jgi:hypothetical protein